jgi:hypothetical protein
MVWSVKWFLTFTLIHISFLYVQLSARALEESAVQNLTNILLLDVYDTTFLVGSKDRCAPECKPDNEECLSTDLNNDDVTRFGLGQRYIMMPATRYVFIFRFWRKRILTELCESHDRSEFGILREHCPFPHLHHSDIERSSSSSLDGNRSHHLAATVGAVLLTDFSLTKRFRASGAAWVFS